MFIILRCACGSYFEEEETGTNKCFKCMEEENESSINQTHTRTRESGSGGGEAMLLSPRWGRVEQKNDRY